MDKHGFIIMIKNKLMIQKEEPCIYRRNLNFHQSTFFTSEIAINVRHNLIKISGTICFIIEINLNLR